MLARKPLRYDELGTSDETIVFLHGLLGRPSDFHSAMEVLAKRYRVIALQFPTDPPHVQWPSDACSIEQLSKCTDELMRTLELENVALCGHSLGGQVAVDYCLRHPERVSRLILTASAGLYEHNIARGRPRGCPHYVREIGRDIFYDPAHITDEHVDFTCGLFSQRDSIRFLLRLAKATRDRGVKENLGRLNIPTLIVWGHDDIITPPFVAEEFRDGIKDAKLVLLDRCGHAPPLEHPEAFAGALSQFLSEPAQVAAGSGQGLARTHLSRAA